MLKYMQFVFQSNNLVFSQNVAGYLFLASKVSSIIDKISNNMHAILYGRNNYIMMRTHASKLLDIDAFSQ